MLSTSSPILRIKWENVCESGFVSSKARPTYYFRTIILTWIWKEITQWLYSGEEGRRQSWGRESVLEQERIPEWCGGGKGEGKQA